MAELWAAFHGAREVLALGAGAAHFAVLADAGAAACRAFGALLAVLAEDGAATGTAVMAPLAVLAEAGAAAGPAMFMALAVRALLADAPPDWVRRRGRFCRNCCSCLHGAKWQQHVFAILTGCL